MTRRARRRAVGVLAFCLTGVIQAADDASWDDVTGPNRAPTEAQVRAHLDALDTDWSALQAEALRVALLDFGAADFRGSTLHDDWQRYALTTQTLAELANKRRSLMEALDRHDVPTATVALWEYRFRGREEAELEAAIIQYWKLVGNHPPDWGPYVWMLRDNGVEQHFARNFESLQRTWAAELSHGLFWQAMNMTWPRIQGLHERGGRADAAALQKRPEVPDAKRLYAVAPPGECNPPAARTSGSDQLKFDDSVRSPPLEYPEDARRQFQEGTVQVGLIVGVEGCVRMASLFASSGYASLDQSAVRFVAKKRFFPAEKDGVAVEHSSTLPIVFKLSAVPPNHTGGTAPSASP